MGWGVVRWIKGVKCMVVGGNLTFGGEYTIAYTDIELQCYIP